MRMPKPATKKPTTIAISADAYDQATTKRLMAAMAAFMAADCANDQMALTQRAA